MNAPFKKITNEDLREDLSVQTEILERVEAKVTKTNGRVTELERFRIEFETRMKMKDELRDRKDSRYLSPIITGLVVGGILLLAQLLMV